MVWRFLEGCFQVCALVSLYTLSATSWIWNPEIRSPHDQWKSKKIDIPHRICDGQWQKLRMTHVALENSVLLLCVRGIITKVPTKQYLIFQYTVEKNVRPLVWVKPISIWLTTHHRSQPRTNCSPLQLIDRPIWLFLNGRVFTGNTPRDISASLKLTKAIATFRWELSFCSLLCNCWEKLEKMEKEWTFPRAKFSRSQEQGWFLFS